MAAQQISILMLGGAKRVSMARHFGEAAQRRGLSLKLYSYELSRRVPISAVAEVIVGLRWSDPAVIGHLKAVIADKGIDIVLPFVDPAIAIAARLADENPNIFAPVSPKGLCDAMHDKLLAAELFERALLPVATPYRKGRPQYPLIAKPRTGSASKGIIVIRNATGFRQVMANAADYIIEEYIEDREEYTVDCYADRSGRICCISPRRRLEVVGGEVSRTVTVDSAPMNTLAANTIHRIGLRGAVTVQILLDRRSDRMMVMEVNPRLGGGAVCSVHAGCDLPGMILDEARGIAPQECTPRPGVEIARYMQEVVFYPDEKQ